ncbi:hypothetical protein SAMN04488127_1166 [Bhargavaea ginsengi]|uniref:DUF1033 domain-containing protein n=1 Tax=Bhargavaea ginsengi TaxID=426757 RepID=A0A1H6WJ17_9BACL|nr:DUF1033 family protein [Bhargavaea ginsengi]SEJ16883.1 hypothetical protein SAMN04488127_1166 [Bhargavaea ginsengi]
MYEIIYMRADYEPWWQFDGWEEHVRERLAFDCAEAAEAGLDEMISRLRQECEHEAEKDRMYWAFWNVKEVCYCEDCAEDLQLYHGIICMKDGKPHPFSKKQKIINADH